MRPCQRLLAVALLLLPAVCLAEPVGYAAGSYGSGPSGAASLYRIDLATGAATEVGSIGYVDVEGIAFAPDGALFAVADSGLACEGCPTTTDLLLRLDPDTGQATLVGPLGLAGAGPGGNLDYGLDFTCDGRLWLSADTTGELWEVDRATGGATPRGNLGVPVSGLAAFGDTLFGISVASDHALYSIEPLTGVASRIGALGALPADMHDAGLAFDPAGRLWATVDYFTPPDDIPQVERNDIASINRSTGAAMIVAPVTGAGSGIFTVQMEGLAIAGAAGCSVQMASEIPAGDPASLLVLAVLLLLVAGPRLRRS